MSDELKPCLSIAEQRIRVSRKTHVEWAAWLRAYPGAAAEDRSAAAGCPKFHDNCIREYDEALADIATVRARVEALERAIRTYLHDENESVSASDRFYATEKLAAALAALDATAEGR